MLPRIYLAGPDVFLPEPLERAAAMKRICGRHGLHAVCPLDPLPGEPPAPSDPHEAAGAMFRRNEAHIRGCDAILANLTPFRGPGADPGTVYEVGFGRALGRRVFGYSTIGADLATRLRSLPGSTLLRDGAGMEIEDFGLFENLMISCGIEESGGFLLARDANSPWDDLGVFEQCAAQASAWLRTVTPPAQPHRAAPPAGQPGAPSPASPPSQAAPRRS